MDARGRKSFAGAGARALRMCAVVLACLPSAGCFGYIMGWSDAEVDRLNGIIAELEAKNAELNEQCLDLKRRVRELEGVPGLDERGAPEVDRPEEAGAEAEAKDLAEGDAGEANVKEE